MSTLRQRIAGAIPDVDAVMALVDDALWMARNTSASGRCRWCHSKEPRPGPGHRMYCRHYMGPLAHSWVTVKDNATFGGLDHFCSCGGWFRLGGAAGHGDGSETAVAVCPNAAKTERQASGEGAG